MPDCYGSDNYFDIDAFLVKKRSVMVMIFKNFIRVSHAYFCVGFLYRFFKTYVDLLMSSRLLLIFFMVLFFAFPKTSFSAYDLDLSIYKKVTEEIIKKINQDKNTKINYDVFIIDNTLSAKDIMRQHHPKHNPQGQFSRNFKDIDPLSEIKFLYFNDCSSDEVDFASGDKQNFDCFLKKINSDLNRILSINIDTNICKQIKYNGIVSQDFFTNHMLLEERKQNTVNAFFKYSRPMRINDKFFIYSENVYIFNNLSGDQYYIDGADGVGFLLSKDQNNEFVVDESKVLWSSGLENTFGQIIIKRLNNQK